MEERAEQLVSSPQVLLGKDAGTSVGSEKAGAAGREKLLVLGGGLMPQPPIAGDEPLYPETPNGLEKLPGTHCWGSPKLRRAGISMAERQMARPDRTGGSWGCVVDGEPAGRFALRWVR